MIAMSRIPDLILLRAFDTVARTRNFTRAAEILNLTQSAVSHQIRKLELEVGSRLFNRNPHEVSLTSDGRRLHTQIAPVLLQLDTIFASGSAHRSEEKLEIELESAFNSDWLTPRLALFTEETPDVRIDLHISAQKRLEFHGDTQFAIKWGKPPWEDYQAVRLMESSLTPMCSPAMLEKSVLKEPADLQKFRLLHDRDETAWRMWMKLAGLKHLNVNSGHIFQDTLALKQAMIRGHGVAIYAKELAERELRQGDLIAPFPDIEVVDAGAYYVITRDRGLNWPAREFLKWIGVQVATQPYHREMGSKK